MKILIDFDGTCVTHAYPNIGEDIGAVPVLLELVERGHQLILFTMRSDIDEPNCQDESLPPYQGDYLTQAIEWFAKNNLELYGVQKDPTQHTWTNSPKAYGELIIDDTCLGIPLVDKKAKTWDPGWSVHHPNLPYSDRPYVDWLFVRVLLRDMKIL